MIRALALTMLLAAAAGCGGGGVPDLNRSFDGLACAARDFSDEPPC